VFELSGYLDGFASEEYTALAKVDRSVLLHPDIEGYIGPGPIGFGIILEEDYIKPLEIKNLQKFADALGISRKTLHKIRTGNGRVTPEMALRLARLFRTTPELWLNLQQK